MKFFTPLATAPVPPPLIDNVFTKTLKKVTSERVWLIKKKTKKMTANRSLLTTNNSIIFYANDSE